MALLRHLLLAAAFAAAVVGAALQPARAALQASPAWWGASAAASSTWHYRVPVTVPAGTVANATAVFNVDFSALLASLGVSGTFDATSPRVVDANGAVVPRQEYTESVYNGATDTTAGRGEVRFLATSNATTYWLYFDITANGTKGAGAGITAIGGNFENSGLAPGTNTTAPAGWTLTRQAGAIDSQIRPSENPSVSADGTTVGNGASPRTVDGTPRTGQYSYLVGARSGDETATGTNRIVLSRTLTVPATNPGVLRIRYRVQGWDSNENGQTQYDYLSAVIVDGGTTANIIGPAANNYTTLPFAPNKGTAQASNRDSGYGQYNGFDTNTSGAHEDGMTVARGAQPWWEATVNLAAYAGDTITLRFSTSHTVQYRSWWHLDDIEWSVVNGTVGTPQGFGAALELPSAATPTHYPTDRLVVRARLDAVGETGSVVADLYRPDGTLAKAGILLYNDGTHGDATAGDALWSNNGSVAAQTTYTFGAADPAGTWSLVLRGADASNAASGQPAGLVRVPGQPVTPVNGTNFSNVDTQVLTFSPFMSISGKVYQDSNRNGAFDTGEPAAAGTYVKLVQGATVQVATPDAGGSYSFTGLRAGSFTVLQSANNLTSDTTPGVPAGMVQSEPTAGGSHAITLAGGVSATANFGQQTLGSRVSGRVFADSGAGNVTALDGVQAGSEPPLAGITVSLLDGGGNVLGTALTRGDGQFDVGIPTAAAGTPVTLSIPAVSGHALGRLVAGSTGGTVSLPARSLAFTPVAGTDYPGVVFSLLPASTLVQGQVKTVQPGGAAAYAHRFTAGANGTVTFALASQPPGALPAWNAVLYRDASCNGVVDGADAPLQGSVALQAGESVCLVVRDLVPQSASIGMSNQHQLSATLVVTEGAGYAWPAVVNLDVTTVGAESGAGLTLTKAVRNLTTGSAWDTAGQALPGQTLQYRLSFRNDTASPITTMQVHDFLPAYAVFVGAACGSMPAGLACSVTQSPSAGATTGAIRWTFTGALAPGAAGEVTFDWTLMN